MVSKNIFNYKKKRGQFLIIFITKINKFWNLKKFNNFYDKNEFLTPFLK